MPNIRTDDPIADFYRHDAEEDEYLKKLPKCEECGNPIQQDTAVCIGDDWYCDECLHDMRKCTGDD